MPSGRLSQYLLKRKNAQPDKTTRAPRQSEAERRLINAESALGRTLFGHVSPDYKREFFCLEKNVWIWYENGQIIRYEVRKYGVYKRIDHGDYTRVQGEELENFRATVKAYLQLVKTQLYH